MRRISCSCKTDSRALAGRRVGNGASDRDEVVWAPYVRYVFTGAAVSAALRDIPRLALLNLRPTGVYVRTDKGITAVHLRSLKRSVEHFACAGFLLLNTGLYVHVRHLANVELEPRSKRVSVQISVQEVEWLRASRRQLRLLRALLGLPSRS
jgi:hypothetical protein